jgi:hypothetical protein
MLNDLRFGLRVLWKSRGFTAVIVLTMALGIGVNTAFHDRQFALRGCPTIPALVIGARSTAVFNPNVGGTSYPDFIDIRLQSRSFKGLGAFNNLQADLSDTDAAAERVSGARISANTFSLLGAQPLIGRDFTAEDEQRSAAPVALLSYGLWQTRYAGDGDILGRTIRINLSDYTVIGVMRPGEGFPQDTRLWIPLAPNPALERRDARSLVVFGRLGDEVRTSAPASSCSRSPRRWPVYPETNKDIEVSVACTRTAGRPARYA